MKKKVKKILLLIFIISIVYLTIDALFLNKYREPDITKLKDRNAYLVPIKLLFVDENKTKSDIKLDEVFENDYMDSILYMSTNYLPAVEDGDYYSINLNEHINDTVLNKIVDSVSAKNNNNGEILNDSIYDEKNKKLSFPKSYFSDEVTMPVQTEYVVRISEPELKNLNIDLSINDGNKKEKNITGDGRVSEISFSISNNKRLNSIIKSDVKIYVNNSLIKLSKDNYQYNSNNGVVTFEYPTAFVRNIRVELPRKNILQKFLSKIANIFTADASYFISENAIKLSTPPVGLSEGTEFEYTAETYYVCGYSNIPNTVIGCDKGLVSNGWNWIDNNSGAGIPYSPLKEDYRGDADGFSSAWNEITNNSQVYYNHVATRTDGSEWSARVFAFDVSNKKLGVTSSGSLTKGIDLAGAVVPQSYYYGYYFDSQTGNVISEDNVDLSDIPYTRSIKGKSYTTTSFDYLYLNCAHVSNGTTMNNGDDVVYKLKVLYKATDGYRSKMTVAIMSKDKKVTNQTMYGVYSFYWNNPAVSIKVTKKIKESSSSSRNATSDDGTFTFSLYSGSSCSGTAIDTQSTSAANPSMVEFPYSKITYGNTYSIKETAHSNNSLVDITNCTSVVANNSGAALQSISRTTSISNYLFVGDSRYNSTCDNSGTACNVSDALIAMAPNSTVLASTGSTPTQWISALSSATKGSSISVNGKSMTLPNKNFDGISLMIGVNNVNDIDEHDVPTTNINATINVVNRLYSIYSKKVYVNSVYHVSPNYSVINNYKINMYIDVFNSSMRSYCDQNPTKCTYIDVVSKEPLYYESGNYRGFTASQYTDSMGLHLLENASNGSSDKPIQRMVNNLKNGILDDINSTLPSTIYVQTKEYTNEYNNYCLKVKKVEKDDTSIGIPGAEIKIYKNSSCTAGTEVDTATTPANGIVTFTGLDDSAYYYKESSAPEGYALDNRCYSATTTQMEGTTCNDTPDNLTNSSYVIQLNKVKEDESTYEAGASFKVYYLNNNDRVYLKYTGTESNGCFKYSGTSSTIEGGSLFTSATSAVTNGVVVGEICISDIPNVSGRKYYAVEYSSNDTRYQNSDESVEMTGPNSSRKSISSVNDYDNSPYLINFYKVDENNSTNVSIPATFKVKDSNNKYVILETNSNNEFVKSTVTEYEGCYIYKSNTTNINNASEIPVLSSDTGVVHKNEICIIRIPNKTNINDTTTLKYTAIELATNKSNYFVPTDNTIENISPSGTLQPFDDSAKLKNRPYVLNFFKVNEEGDTNERLLNGAEFSITNSNGTTIGYKGTESYTDEDNHTKTCYIYSTASDATTKFISGENGDNGEVCLVRVPKTSGSSNLTYTITETHSAKYHTFGNYKSITLSPTKKFQSKLPISSTDKNKFINYPTVFEFTKTVSSGDRTADGVNWENITTKELQKLSFNIYDSNGSILSFIETSTGVYEFAGNNIDGITGTAVTDLKLDNNRKFKIYHLEKGIYSIKEKKVCCDSSCGSCTGGTECSGFYYPSYTQESSYKFEITECSSASATSCTQSSVSTKSLNNTPTEITFTKNDLYNYIDATDPVKFENEDEINAFDNIKFRLKDESGNYVPLIKVGNTGSCNNTSSYAEYRYVTDTNILSAEERAKLVTDIYTCGGNIKINHLCRGKKFTIEEYEVPNNTVFINSNPHITKDYLLPFTEDGKNCCDDNPVTTVTTQTISDTPTRIALFKKNNRTSTDIHEASANSRKETATFEVYACTNLNARCTKETSTGTKVKFQNARTYGSERVYPFRLDQSTIDSETVTTLFLTTEGNKGKIVLEYLPANYRYVVVETSGPDGYYDLDGSLAETEIEYIPKDTNNSSDNIKNIINYPTMILFRKTDIYKYYNSSDSATLNSNNEIFDTMTFVLRDKDGNIVSLSKTTDGEYRFIQDDGTTTGNSETNLHTKDGSLLITNLYRNEKYYIEETATDTLGNFILPTNVTKPSGIPSGWTWRGHPFVSYDINSMLPSDTESGTVPSESVTSLIENKPTRVVFEKRDKATGVLIDDTLNNDEDTTYLNTRTTFNVYRCPKTVEHCRATTEGAELVYFEGRAFVFDENDNDITNDLTSVTPPVLTYKYSKLNSSVNAVSDLITDRGVLVLAYLPSEYSYSLYEKTAPNGYYQPSGAEAYTEFIVLGESAPDGSDYVELTEKIENTPTEIYFEKSDLYNYYEDDDLASLKDDSLKIFDSISFVLKDKNGNVLKLKCSSDGEFVSNKNTNDKCDTGEYRYIPVDNNNKIDTIHTKNGKLKITHLYKGEIYYIEEISSDTEGNFILPDYMNRDMNYGDVLPFDNHGHPVVKYILPQDEPSDKSSVTAEIKNTPSRVAFQKKDSKYGYLIPDETTTFKIYQCSTDIECHPSDYSTDEERNAHGITLLNFNQRGVITGDNEDLGKEVYKYKKLNESGETELHPYKGELIIRYLPSDGNYKYVLLETVSPKNYTLPRGRYAETEFTISQSKVEVEEIDVPNKPTSLLLKKYSDDGELLEGAEFEIYEGTTCDPSLSAMAQPKELLSFKTITDGIYEYRRNFDTSKIRTCTDTVDGKCSGMTNTLTFEDYVDTWANFENSVNQREEEVEIKAGEALIQYLEYGHCYIIKEVKAPKGYSLPEKEEDRYIMVRIEKEDDVVDTYKELINKPTPYTFYKFDEYNELIDGAEFKLQKLNSDKVYEDVTVSLYETEVDRPNKGKYYKVDNATDNTLITTVNGAATIFFLEEGQYRIVETKAPEGKELPAKQLNVATFLVDKDGRVTGSSIITNKPKTEKIEVKPKAEAELIVNISTGQQVIRYGLIIVVIVISICGLIMVQNKQKKDK